jgi:NADPH:quinone reductase-like Zn-dependent oxidoreductase
LIEQAEERNPIAMSIPATMRALQQTSLNGPQDLRLITDAPVPVPGPGEVLIRVTAAASPGKHETVRALGADHVLDSRGPDVAAEVLRLTGGTGTDLVLESAGGATFGASLTAAKRVTGRSSSTAWPAAKPRSPTGSWSTSTRST